MYFVYILRCADGSLYAGITTDVERRVYEHNTSSKAARYTRARRPVVLVYQHRYRSRAAATREEMRIKQLTRKEKLMLIAKKK